MNMESVTTMIRRSTSVPLIIGINSRWIKWPASICLCLVLITGCPEAKDPVPKTPSVETDPPPATDPEKSSTKEPTDSSTDQNPNSDPDTSVAEASSRSDSAKSGVIAPTENAVRFATFNVAMNRPTEGELKTELMSGDSPKTNKIAEIIQRVRPDVLLLNEFDYDADGDGINSFQEKFLSKSQNGLKPIEYEHVYFQAVNTGVDTELDLNKDGETGTPNDAYGFGVFPGQYGMVVLSHFPIDFENIRTFQNFLWKDMPDNLWPVDPKTKLPYYDAEIKMVFRLSSKSHWDVPIQIDDQTIHFLVSHPTPPVFDDEEDRNGSRNHDEIRFWVDYISSAEYPYDDAGVTGGLPEESEFVIAGDLNADPVDGDSNGSAAKLLTTHELINASVPPESEGGAFYAKEQGGINQKQSGNPSLDTGDFNDFNVGNMRIDYCLPSKNLSLLKSGVFWPKPGQPGADAVTASDHRMVWIDVEKQ